MTDIAKNLFTFEGFLYTYAIFLFSVVMFISLGAGTYFTGNIAGLEAPTFIQPEPHASCTYDNILGYFWCGISATLDFLKSILSYITYAFQNLAFFFTLMTMDLGYTILGYVIFAPAIVIIGWAIIKLIANSLGGSAT